MLEELTCPECGYKTPFYTCLQCGATIKNYLPAGEDAEGREEAYLGIDESGDVSRCKPENMPDRETTTGLSPTTELPNGEGYPEAIPSEGVHGTEPGIDSDYGTPWASTDKVNNYKGPSPAVRNAFIVLGVMVMLFKTYSLLMQFGVISTPGDFFAENYSPLSNKITITNPNLIQAIEDYQPFPEKSDKTLLDIMESYVIQDYRSYYFNYWDEADEGEYRVINAHYTVGDIRYATLAAKENQPAANQELSFRWVMDEEGNIRAGNQLAESCVLTFKARMLAEQMNIRLSP